MLASLVWSGLAIAIVMLLTITAMVLLMPRLPIRYRAERRLVPCPADGRMAQVDFVFRSDDGEVAVDVLRCSHRPGELGVACGRECRSASVAPFGARPAAG
jgi:hypothetical protein